MSACVGTANVIAQCDGMCTRGIAPPTRCPCYVLLSMPFCDSHMAEMRNCFPACPRHGTHLWMCQSAHAAQDPEQQQL